MASGSDDGRWFIWLKKTGRLIKMLNGDESGGPPNTQVLLMMSFSFHYNDIHMPFFTMTSCLFSFYSNLLSLRAHPIGFFT